MTINIQDILLDGTTTFDTWRVRTNEIAAAMRSNVVTVGGDAAVGDAVITGSLSADDLYASNLWGGSKTAVGNLTVKTNTSFQGQVDAVDIFLTGSLTLLNNTKLVVPGSTSTAKYLEFDPLINTPTFVHIPRFQDISRTNGSILVWNTTTNQYEHNTNVLVDVINNNVKVNVNFTVDGTIISNNDVNLKKGTLTLIHTSYTPGTDGDTNLFIGQGAGNPNVGQGFVNTWEGCRNVAIGRNAGIKLTTGYNNTAIGSYSLDAETTGHNNTAIGYGTLSNQNGGSYNTAIGRSAGINLTTGYQNVAIGSYSLDAETTGFRNVAIGDYSLSSQNGGYDNVGVGKSAGLKLTTGFQNIAIGSYALDAETTGNSNVAVGHAALSNQNGALQNVALGRDIGFEITTGSVNTLLGHNTGRGITTGSNNTIVGANVNLGNVTNNIALATGDGTVRLRYDGSKWVNSEKITWLNHVQAELHFDSAGSDGGGHKRITCNDGYGNWNFRSGEYYNYTNAQLEYSTTDQSAAHISINTENLTGGAIHLTTYGPNTTGIAGSAVQNNRSLRILNQNNDVEYFDGTTWHRIWHQGNISPRITALPAAIPENITGNETVPIDTGEKLPLVNVITDSIRGLTANTTPTGNEFVAVDTGVKVPLNAISWKPDDEYAVGFFDAMPYYSTNISWVNISIPFKLKDGGVAVLGNLWNSYNKYRVNVDALCKVSSLGYSSANITNLDGYAMRLDKKPIPDTEKPGNSFPLGADRQKIIEDWKSKGYFNNVKNVAVCSYAYYVVYESGILVGTGRNNQYVMSDASTSDVEGFTCPWDDYLPGGNLDLNDPNKKVVDIYINQGKGTDYPYVHPTTPIFKRTDGKLVARGYNVNGERAKGDTATTAGSNLVMIDANTPLSNVAFVKSLDCYPSSFYAWLNDGSVYVWGKNTNGMLFTGDITNKTFATLITNGPGALANKGLPDKVYVVGGNGHANILCHYKNSKELYVMGNNSYGQLLDGTTTNNYNGPPNLISNVDDVFACEHALYGSQAVYFFNKNGLTWGAGHSNYYQTGTGKNIVTNKNPRIVINGDINVGIAATYGGVNIGFEDIISYIGDMPNVSNIFDRKGYSLFASTGTTTYANGTGVYAGVELANPRTIQGGWTKPYWDANGYTSVAGGKVIIEMYGSNILPINATDGILLGSVDMSAGNIDPATADVYIPSLDTTTAYKYIWFYIINQSGGAAGLRLNKAGFVSTNPNEQIVMKKMYKSQRWEGGVIAQSTSGNWWAWGYHGSAILPYASDTNYPADPDDVAIKIEWPFEEDGEEIIDIRMDYQRGAAISNKGNVYMWGKTASGSNYPLTIPFRAKGRNYLPPVKIDMGAYK